MAHLHTTIAEVTGSEPVTCPWRVYDDPVVQQGRVLLARAEKGGVDMDRQLAVLVDAADTIGNVANRMVMMDMRQRREQQLAEDMRRGKP